MRIGPNIFNTINTRILLVLLALFIVIAGVVGMVNTGNIRGLYEESYTDRLMLTNALMGSFIHGEDVEHFAKLMKNQGDDFRQRQIDFYHDREELFRLQEENAPEEKQQEIMDRLAAFHAEMQAFKNEVYWDTLAELKKLKAISGSTYVYVMADIGLETRDGEPLYTYIYDAEDEGEYSSPDMDGLGTSDIGNEAFTNVFLTKKQTEKAEHYEGDFGELYFVCVPILDDDGNVVAVLGTDLSLDDMNSAIASSTKLFNGIIITVFLLSAFLLFAVLSSSIAGPISSLTGTALAFAEGKLHTTISKSALKQRTEVGTLANALKSTLDATTLYLDSVPEGLFIMNRACETLFRNETFIRRFGDMQAPEFMAALFPVNMSEELEKSLNHEGNTATVWVGLSCFAVMLKEIVLTNMPENSILVIANDITDLMREKENAQAAAAAKSEFMSRMSHEMRTPMNAIIGMAKVAEDSDSVPNIKHCIETISASSEQLLSIINDILDMSKIDAGKLTLDFAPINIEKMLLKVCGLILDAAEKKKQSFNVSLSCELRLHYIADELRLSQVLTNLLSNAVKFTPPDGAITLTVEKVGQLGDADILRFSVSDTGIGMTDKQIARLFSAFEQGDGGSGRKYGGTGLGLVISQSIVRMMGGHITVESAPGAGTTLHFDAAFRRTDDKTGVTINSMHTEDIRRIAGQSESAANDSGADAADIVPDLSGIRLILAEDIDINREVFLALMEGTGVTTDIAENGSEAVSRFLKNPGIYDLIFMDIQMPEMDGYEATRVIRASGVPEAKTIPIVAMSANAFKEDIDRCLECGMDDHLAKPIDVDTVIEKILQYTSGREK